MSYSGGDYLNQTYMTAAGYQSPGPAGGSEHAGLKTGPFEDHCFYEAGEQPYVEQEGGQTPEYPMHLDPFSRFMKEMRERGEEQFRLYKGLSAYGRCSGAQTVLQSASSIGMMQAGDQMDPNVLIHQLLNSYSSGAAAIGQVQAAYAGDTMPAYVSSALSAIQSMCGAIWKRVNGSTAWNLLDADTRWKIQQNMSAPAQSGALEGTKPQQGTVLAGNSQEGSQAAGSSGTPQRTSSSGGSAPNGSSATGGQSKA
ncbi:MAG TPA: hypothetical protein V6C52_10780 [Coleofasciculaceae cyanobacterium]|jgi:hypothetical protein